MSCGGCVNGVKQALLNMPDVTEVGADDQSVLYAISSIRFDVKGILVNGYGISADAATT